MTYDELVDLWLSVAGGTSYDTVAWANLMAAIAMAESSGNPDAVNPNDNNGTQTSWGLFQISLGNHNPPSPEWNVPAVNAQLAIGKLETQGITCWGTYDSGAYKQYLQNYVPPPPASTQPSSEDLDMSTQSSNGVVSLSVRPGSVSHVQVTTDLGGPGPLELRVVLALPTGPWVQYGGGGGNPNFSVSSGYGNFALPSQFTNEIGGISLEATQTDRVFSATAY
jgi:hypothetical protein